MCRCERNLVELAGEGGNPGSWMSSDSSLLLSPEHPSRCISMLNEVCTPCSLSGHQTQGLIVLKCLLLPASAWAVNQSPSQ